MKTKKSIQPRSWMAFMALVACWLLPSGVWASYWVDGIYFDLNTSARTATVTSNPDKYSGKIIIPEYFFYDGNDYTVTQIGTCAFLDCNEMEEITIPNSVTVIEPSAFERCSGLTTLTVGKGVTTIDYEAFKNCSGLTTLILPTSLKTIGNESFGGCTSLRTIIEERTTAPTIVSTTFNGVDKNACTLYVPEGCKSVYANAAYWKQFTNIVDDVLTTGPCGDNLTYTIYPDMRVVISGTGEMWNRYDSENPLTKEYSQSIQQVIVEEGVTSIAAGAFQGCSDLTSVDIPTSMERIEGNAFTGCEDLQRINITDIAAWCNIDLGDDGGDQMISYAFDSTPLYLNGKEITNLIIPEGVTTISRCAFRNCENLWTVKIPDSVESIEMEAFAHSGFLNLVNIGKGLRSIAIHAFTETYIDRIICNASNPPVIDIPAFSSENQSALYVPYGSKEAYEQAADGNFHYWKRFGSIDEYFWDNGLSYILEPTEQTASIILADATTEPVEVVIPSTIELAGTSYPVTTICQNAFQFCTGLTAVTIPSSIEGIETDAFTSCCALERINISDLAAWCSISLGTILDYVAGYAFPHLPLYLNGEKIEQLVIPEEVSYVEEGAFVGCSGLTSLIIPNWIQICLFAFNECGNLDFVKMGPGSLQGSALCNNLKTIVLTTSSPPSLGSWAAFLGKPVVWVPYGSASNYKNDTNPYGAGPSWRSKDIHEYYRSPKGIFYGLEPEGQTTKVISTDYFDDTDLMEVTIPSTIKCDDVTYTVTGIGHKAFEINRSVTKIILPSTITSVEDFAFSKCTSLTDLYCNAEEPPTVSASAFGNLNVSEVVLHVPAGSKSAYESAEGWKDFANIVEDEYVVGDANGDGKVRIGDASAILRFIVGDVPDNFNEKAADVNGDGLIRIGDVSAVLNIIVNQESE